MSDKLPLRLEWVHPVDLTGNPANWRRHPDLQRDALEALLYGEDAVGWAGAALWNERTNRLIDGHLRREVAAVHDEPIPVLIGSWTEEEERKILATLDPIAAMAETNREALGALLQGVKSDEAAVQKMLAELAEREGVFFGGNGGGGGEVADLPPQINRAEELREAWGVELGQVWRLGEHRLICGDCTDKAVVERVMDGEYIDLVLTDPPYSVNYAAKNRALQTIGRSNRLTTDISGDTLSTQETAEAIWGPAFENAYNHSRNGTVIYCFAPQGGDQMMMMMMMKAKWNERLHQLIWKKNAPTFSMGRLDYQYQHEPVLYSWRGTNHQYYGETGRSVIEFDRPSSSGLHPTMKPVELIKLFIGNSSQRGEIVYDPFLGSGTTLIACEQLNRKCRAMEISPSYCAVTLQRYHDLTGLEPVRIG